MKALILSLAFLMGGHAALAADLGTKIADCTVPADANNPATHVQVFRNGTDKNDKSELSVQVGDDAAAHVLPVDDMRWSDDGSTLGIQCRFVVFQIKNGESTDSTIGVMLGAPPQNIKCSANL